ncbi:MAG: hypothetical protein LUQ16_08545 [Methanomassiliicoccales archaeon]|jgi:hypothetical protein|nr:hypothetical protein [Methanomassiliicoccales archaeon]MDD1756065.1 hypothetical protein [Methanomassiliicoccales archaeon]
MGKAAISVLTSLALVVLLSFSMLQPMSGASETTASCGIESMVLEDQYRLVITLGPWSKTVQLSNIGIVIVPPVTGSPEMTGEPQYLKLVKSLNMSIGDQLRMSYEAISNQGHASDGDRIEIQSTGTDGLPQGQWQLYLDQESTTFSILGVIWTIGNEQSTGYHLPYARSSITDPLQHFNLNGQGSTWTFMAIFGSEILLLAVIVYLISRAK